MEFQWDPDKALENEQKHEVTFLEAIGVFNDDLSSTVPDPDHSEDERRWVTFGYSSSSRLLVVSHTERDDTSRIINARRATRSEQKIYEEG